MDDTYSNLEELENPTWINARHLWNFQSNKERSVKNFSLQKEGISRAKNCKMLDQLFDIRKEKDYEF